MTLQAEIQQHEILIFWTSAVSLISAMIAKRLNPMIPVIEARIRETRRGHVTPPGFGCSFHKDIYLHVSDNNTQEDRDHYDERAE